MSARHTDPTTGETYWEIDHGYTVVDADGETLGEVADVHPHYLTVSKGVLFTTELSVPDDAITTVERERVSLNITKDQIQTQGWDRTPPTDRAVSERDRVTSADSDRLTNTAGTTATTRTTDATRTDQERLDIPVAEEQLNVGTREVERGRVRLRKRVLTEEQTVNVPLREEHVQVERHAVDTQTDAVPADAFQELDIEIPLRGEEADVSKQTVVTGEVEVHKHVRERQEQVGGTLRREEVVVEGVDGAIVEEERTSGRATDAGASGQRG